MRVFYITFSLFLMAGLAWGIQVADVIDGDTFRLEDGQKVRLIGVDCPESKDPNKPVEYFSGESKAFLESLIQGKDVRLEYGDERTDKYGRLLCYVWVKTEAMTKSEKIADLKRRIEALKTMIDSVKTEKDGKKDVRFPDTATTSKPARDSGTSATTPYSDNNPDDALLVNLEIIENGYGLAYLRFPHKLEKQFLEAEIAARRAAIGMWASPRNREIIQDVSPKTSPEWEEYQQMLKEGSSQETTVYITKSGSKYHRASCRYLSKSKIPISLKDAKERGYSPCKVCKPPK